MKRQAAAKEALKVDESSETPHGSEALEAATEQKESTEAQKRYATPAATDGDSTMEDDGSDTPWKSLFNAAATSKEKAVAAVKSQDG